jgi:hypothetical protein
MLNAFQMLRSYLRLREAIKKADKAHAKDGERYYVMPAAKSNNLIIMDRFNFRKLKQKGYITPKAHVRDLVAECFYCTPYRNGDGKMPVSIRKLKVKSYFCWVEAQRKLAKAKRRKAKEEAKNE